MDLIVGLCLGVGLSAAAGFRVFVPLLVMNLAALSGHLELAESMQWVGSPLATAALAVATGLEIAAYYVPWVDNMLDTVASPAAVVAGTVATASVLTGVDPALQWGLAIVAGGGAAAAVQTVTVGGRAISTLTTGGLGNPAVSTTETVMSAGVSLLAIVLPIVAALLVTLAVGWLARLTLLRRRRHVVAGAASVPEPPTGPTLPPGI